MTKPPLGKVEAFPKLIQINMSFATPSCMVLMTDSFFEALGVFDAIDPEDVDSISF